MKKLLIATLLLLFVIAAVAGIGLLWFQANTLQALDPDGINSTVTIESGTNAEQILEMLETEGFIGSKLAAQIYIRLNPDSAEFKAGEHNISSSLSLEEILAVLSESPERKTVWITIPEGMRYTKVVEQIRAELTGTSVALDYELLTEIMDTPENYYEQMDQDVVSFLLRNKPDQKTIEGFLYPDTYNIDVQITEIQLVELFVYTLIDKLAEDDLATIATSDYNLYQILNIAGMLEREANTEEDFKLVAGVLYNRLEQNMRLDVDATILYGLDKDGSETIFQSEIDDVSNPYNTRRLSGLPPTPISNPGITAIKAAIHPAKSDFLFYLTGNDGKTYYAKTNNEHVNNINKYLN